MVDHISKEKRSKVMSAIKSKNTKPELALMNTLTEEGIEFEPHYGEEKIDIAFPEKKIAIFVDGCFWHRCPLHGHTPKSNQDYWIPKLNKNIERDKAKNARLKKSGWIVKRFWEHELTDLISVKKEILVTLKSKK